MHLTTKIMKTPPLGPYFTLYSQWSAVILKPVNITMPSPNFLLQNHTLVHNVNFINLILVLGFST